MSNPNLEYKTVSFPYKKLLSLVQITTRFKFSLIIVMFRNGFLKKNTNKIMKKSIVFTLTIKLA